ncbi:MAG: tRNA (adenosine(37)-N6)-threonylcarbamoyltransferase complex dimerization subunit type 1 TsaB [Bacteroidetes bacterium]|nr:tRNA (adenosine(37)-N6)-threonylcarbamoyltransferase complex dimerization subunit type 1 TsaB [Bacteroidota bacterium]
MMILCLETATPLCSAALVQDGKVQASAEVFVPQAHARLLTTLVQQVLANAEVSVEQLQAVACAAGPGSYTGLRIGASTAKGIAQALDIPLIAISTLEALAAQAATLAAALGARIIPLMDAGRMEVYTALYDPELNCLKAPAAEIVDDNWIAALPGYPLLFIGDGAPKCHHVLHQPPQRIVWDGPAALAAGMAVPASRAFSRQQFADLHGFEPAYLKPVRLTTPRKLV